MSFSSTTARVQDLGDGSTVNFPVTFPFQADADLAVVVTTDGVDVTKTLNTDYTVSGEGTQGGGNVKFITAPASGTTVTIFRDLDLNQTRTFTYNGQFPTPTVTAAADKAMQAAQQLNEKLKRVRRVSVVNAEIPEIAVADRAGTVDGWDDEGNPTQYPADVTLLPYAAPYATSTIASLKAISYALVATGTQVSVTQYASAGDGGGGLFVVDKSDTTTADDGGTVIVAADGTRLKRVIRGPIDARIFGSKWNGVDDDTSPLQAAIDYCISSGVKLLLPAGTAKITASLDLGAAGASGFLRGPVVIGAGRGASIIKQFTANTPIIKFGGSFGRLEGVDLVYNTQQTSSDTSAYGIGFFAAQWFIIRDVNVYYSCTGLFIPQTAVVAGANVIFNGTIEDVYIIGFRKSAVNLTSYAGGSGGMRLANIWTKADNTTPTATDTPFIFGSFSDTYVERINVQDQLFPQAVYSSGGRNLVFNCVHVEACTPNSSFNGIFTVDNGAKVEFRNVTLQANSFLSGTGNNIALFRLLSGSQVIVSSLSEEASTKTSTTYLLATDSNADNSFTLEDDALPPSFTAYNLGLDASVITRVGTLYPNFALGLEGFRRVVGAAAPVSGTWAVGDIVYYQFPTAGGFIGWVCVTAGTPGTWKTWGAISV